MFSARSTYERHPNPVETLRRRLLQQGLAITDLTESNPTAVGLRHTGLAHLQPSLPLTRHYTPHPLGLPTARAAVAKALQIGGNILKSEQILLTASTSEAYAYLFKMLCNSGDEILVPQPSYPLLDQLAQAEGVRLVRYPLRWAGQWQLDISDLASRLTNRSRAIVVINPNNPTGSYVRAPELAALLDFKLPLISDEVFFPYALSSDKGVGQSLLAVPSATGGSTPHFVLGGLSKFMALPQLKCSWCVACGTGPMVDEALWRLECLADTFLSVNTPVQEALPRLLDHAQGLQVTIAQRLNTNLSCLAKACAHPHSALTLRAPEGGWFAVVQLPNIYTDEQWTLSLLQNAHVLVQPGYFFDFLESSCIVISLLCDSAVFSQGVEDLSRHIRLACSRRS